MHITKSFVRKLYPPRPTWCHKGECGRLLVVAGSRTYTGSPTLAAMAAVKSGADWVDVVAPTRPADAAAANPDLITHPQRGDFLNPWHLTAALSVAKRNSAAVIGNGIGRRRETEAFVIEFLRKTPLPIVIDADALHVVAKKEFLLKPHHILTPHAYEFFLLTGQQPTDSVMERQGIVQRFAKKLGCTILLKGSVDVVSDGKKTACNSTGHPAMAKSGTGDTLAGIAGALLARGAEPFRAAAAAAWINGAAGERAAKEMGESLAATDILENIHKVLI